MRVIFPLTALGRDAVGSREEGAVAVCNLRLFVLFAVGKSNAGGAGARALVVHLDVRLGRGVV